MQPTWHMQMRLQIALRRLLLTSLCFSAVCLALPAAAQTASAPAQSIPAGDSKLIEIKVTGSKRFTQAEVAAACGLPLGAIVDNELFRKAARQLGETGAFNDISYTYTFSSAGTKLAFQVTDADKFVPAHFADFVWFSDQELLQKVHERIPLFNGELPTTGRLPDQVSDVLQAMLVENGVPGHVEYSRTGAGHVEAIDYAIDNVTIRIRRIEFAGAGPAELPLLETAAEKLAGRDYYRALLKAFVEHSVLPVYHELGYLKASCDAAEPKVVKDASADAVNDKQAVTLVDVTVPIRPGAQYKLGGWTWSDNKNISTDTLQSLLHAKAGQPANTVQLEDDLRAVQTLYGSRGYVTATIKANAQFDEAASTVSYQLVVSEGPVYHMGELEFRGIDNNLTARLRAAWKIHTGDVYDVTYLKEFLPLARKLLPSSIDWDVAPHVTAIARDKVVDVDLQYTAKAPQ
ncbi:MAG: POTRA domain-containing protein [Candidatus Sulfotelmatobacter sp.]